MQRVDGIIPAVFEGIIEKVTALPFTQERSWIVDQAQYLLDRMAEGKTYAEARAMMQGEGF